MVFNEYRTACKRHMQACDKLLQDMEDANKFSEEMKKNILQEIYYLAGYMFECIYKYALFALINYDPQKSVEDKDEIKKKGLKSKKIFSHDFTTLKEIIEANKTATLSINVNKHECPVWGRKLERCTTNGTQNTGMK